MPKPKTAEIGKKIIYLQEVSSTNEYAKKIASEMPEGTVVIAKKQTKGKGRKNRRWASPEGGLWLSVILKPDVEAKDIPKIVFVGALAVVDTLAEFGIEAGIKWPNDVWVDNKKICGILTEGRLGEFVILGIGLNVNNDIPSELIGSATSMRLLLGRELNLDKVLWTLLGNLERWYKLIQERKFSIVMSAVKDKCFILGRWVEVINDESKVEGEVIDIAEDGTLIIQTSKGLMKIFYGDISLRLR